MKRHIVLGIILLLLSLLYACTSVPRFTLKNGKQEPSSEKTETIRYHNYAVLETVTGVASFYADEFHGRITSNGEVYDMYGLTAAHPTYPHGTIIRITNLTNNKSVIVRVNDRMPYRPDRIIDLSYGTAQELGMVESGLVKVKLEILEWGEK